MGITDEKLREDKILIERKHLVRNTGTEYDTRITSHNVADWLVDKFCGICPHREA